MAPRDLACLIIAHTGIRHDIPTTYGSRSDIHPAHGRLGGLLGVQTSLHCAVRFVRTVKPEASWALTLQGAELEANKLAKEHREAHHCKHATIQALAGHQYRWQASPMSAFDNQRCVASTHPQAGLLNAVCSVDRGQTRQE